MNFKRALSSALLSISTLLAPAAWGQERGEQRPRPEEQARPHARPAPAPQQFKAHPPGEHPHGPVVRQHPVRVLPPKVVARGRQSWPRWNHPEMARPVYYWNWGAVRSVTCISEDSYGDQYPVSETVGGGFGPDQMTFIEDDALDRCYSESGQDPTCYLATCSHF